MNIEAIKKSGQVRAIYDAIDTRLSNVERDLRKDIKSGNCTFRGLGVRLDATRAALDEIEALLKELRELDGAST